MELIKIENPYDVQLNKKVIVNKGNRPILTVSHIIGQSVWFEETNDNCLITECSPTVCLTYNGGHEVKISAELFESQREYFSKQMASFSLCSAS